MDWLAVVNAPRYVLSAPRTVARGPGQSCWCLGGWAFVRARFIAPGAFGAANGPL